MKNLQLPVIMVLLLGTCRVGALDNGTIVEQIACPPMTMSTYEEYVESFKAGYAQEVAEPRQEGIHVQPPRSLTAALLSREEFQSRKAYLGFECRRIKYLSDGLRIVGYLWKPKNTEGKKFPLIIFNRGGNREFGSLSPWMRFGMYSFLSNGFIVLASQYRGNDGGEGREEFGGIEVDDVLNLIPLAKSLGYVDMKNVFILGWSRGGMETYLALKNKIPVNAAAVIGGITDLKALAEKRPEMITGVYEQLIPDFTKRGDRLLRERSAIYWADQINVPILIMQGGADTRIDTGMVLAFVQRLQELGKIYEFVIYANDDHAISLNVEDSDRRILAWFRRYLK